MYIQVYGNSASRNSVCTKENLWRSFSKAKVKVVLVKVNNYSYKVQVKLHDSLQENFCYRQDVGVIPYKQLKAPKFLPYHKIPNSVASSFEC